MVENVTQVAWKIGYGSSGWSITGPSRKRNFLFSWFALLRAPRNLRSDHAQKDFDRLFESASGGQFLSWWDQVGGAPEDKFYALDFPSGRWEIPWEILIRRLKETEKHGTICMLRRSGGDALAAPSAFSDPMRMLVIQGDDGEFIGQKIDLAREATQITEAWEALDATGRDFVVRPVVAPATKANLTSLIAEHRPHILWFSGHGGRKPHTNLLLADRQRVNAKDFAALIHTAGHTPLYVVFWACDTGARAEDTAETASSPDLFRELKQIGVLSVLAIQSPIRDSNATVLARQLFLHLSSGLSLEISATRARAALLDDPADDTVLDWASPVVWSTVRPVRKLQWNQLPSDVALNQLLGRKVLRLGTSRPVQLEQMSSSDDRRRASGWLQTKRTWVHADPKEPTIRQQWFLTLQAVQQATSKFVILVDLRGCDAHATEQQLRVWAEEIRSRIVPGDLPDWFAALVSGIVDLPASGWQHLCATREMVLAICDPPPYETPSWFWEPLLALNSPQVLSISGQAVDDRVQDSWSVDKLGELVQEENILQAIQQAPRLAASLAVSRMPIGQSYIYLSGADVQGAGSLLQWQDWTDVTVSTPAGPIMTASARHSALERLDPAARIQAHKDWLEIFSHVAMAPSAPVLQERLSHLLAAEMFPEALEDATELLDIYREQDRPNAALALLDELGDHKVDLPSDACLRAAWATLQFGEVDEAQYWLDRTAPGGSLERAWKHGLQAEIDKSTGDEGSKAKALGEIDSAVEICAAALERGEEPLLVIERRHRAYRQDRARILHYLFGRLQEARTEYERLVAEWTNDEEAQFDLAVVKRNMAPCLWSLANQS
jgi:tetratricopeptide (TPR) repeat protein